MTVAVSCNLSEGVILAADSAVTIATPGTPKVFNTAEKLYPLRDLPIGVATYGLAALGARNIGSYIREFEVKNATKLLAKDSKPQLKDVVEALRSFFSIAYNATVVPALQEATGKSFSDLPPDQVPILGLVIGGFSADAYLSEVWNVVVPQHAQPQSAECVAPPSQFGSSWFAASVPIVRYIKGFDPTMIGELIGYFVKGRGGAPLSPQEQQEVWAICTSREYQVPFVGMPFQEGIAYARFLVELVVNHHRFAVGEQLVGGRVQLGAVMYRDGEFKLVDPERSP